VEIGWNCDRSELRDLDQRPICNLFTLYPWEWLLGESAEIALAAQQTAIVMEPIWKMLWSNKGLLAILWEIYLSGARANP
jgi:glutathionylspermidine synthase